MRYGNHGTAFDLTDVRADAARDAYLQRQIQNALAGSRTAYRRGWTDANELFADVTVTDGIPITVDED